MNHLIIIVVVVVVGITVRVLSFDVEELRKRNGRNVWDWNDIKSERVIVADLIKKRQSREREEGE